jgi:mannose-6-phosphate isomerase-like protein (cupin superfamily)
MEIVTASEEKGVDIPQPYLRTIKVLLAPDRSNVDEVTFSVVFINPDGRTDYHEHDRPELIYIVSGTGESICEGKSMNVIPDTVLWITAGEKHQIINNGEEVLKLATVFVPAYTASEIYARCLTAANS